MDIKEQLVKKYKQMALDKLSAIGIDDCFVVKVKNLGRSDWVACYQSLSQFKNNNRGPIFWVSPDLLLDQQEFVISILHEYGHVIAEYAYVNDCKNTYGAAFASNKKTNVAKPIKQYWGKKYSNKYWDEEEFAEDFAQFVYGTTSKKKKAILSVVKEYNKAFNE